MSVTASTPIDLSSVVESQQPLEAVLLITRTGAQLGAWRSRSHALLEVRHRLMTPLAARSQGSGGLNRPTTAVCFFPRFRGVLVRFQRNAWIAARATTGDIPIRIGTVGTAGDTGETPWSQWSAITVTTAVLTFPDVSIARA